MAKRQSQTSIVDFINCKRNTAASESRPDTEEVYDIASIAESESSTINQSFSQKTRLNYLPHGIKILNEFSSVLSQSTRLTDERTDGHKEFLSLDRVCISCSAVKIGRLGVRQKSIPRRTIRQKIDPLAYVRPTKKA